ncbi:prephenate dehydrogenase/arogenate dehydrogenase family protein [Gluconobacter wancherniae]|uniref:prephenate dehydrogenase n=1 Tax=Gluconobacter wancherniae NBRC 103581 TaxID=656744 RepID=A0A511AYF9_9PROT|nr:prephenate dehydrogenase/arogenate dehydrogenase family protein [Gluconobacter wancherniae]MBF0853386.1 prephenate dehydrogenase/arogenate dehydrogenase family protein [Gluconobacter wancherniae]GBD55881.1 cyclohexadienyl dehydrogenase [Gluconobacter wancherniae NBRC 103581]GBR65955.1 cyclohexadienyl/arogenate/prephenate dehydrogenase [Gluconobacter wancherniae NBRC 103581]GEK93216.1 cyclohexadienyl dehydrogenase [Gluconobacter wancherniae NBRC 103581]
MTLFKSLAVVGPGLIGSSILRRAREDRGIAQTLIAADSNAAVLDRVRELGLADIVTADLAEAAKADCVVLCVPVGAVEAVALEMLPYMKQGAILTDVASVRGQLGPRISTALPTGVSYVPAHPMAGTEHSGPDAGFATLFEDRWCLLIPPANTDTSAIHKIEQLWKQCGARTRVLEDAYHDQVCAIVSHLPHLLAFTICDTADNLSDELRADVLEYAASGFRDFTRIAASDPVMWRDIFLANREILLETLDRFTADTKGMADAIRAGDVESITDRIARGRQIRRTLIANRQA